MPRLRTCLRARFVAPTFLVLALLSGSAFAQDNESDGFARASNDVQAKLDTAVDELDALRERIADEKLPLTRELSRLEDELLGKRQSFQETSRLLDNRTLDLTNLRSEIESREAEINYLSNLLSEYVRNFETRLHIAELQRYEAVLDEAKLASENSGLSERAVFEKQAALLRASIARLRGAIGGTRFAGTAVDENGIVQNGEFLLVGPYALFRSADGQSVGTAEQRLGSLEPTVVPFARPEDGEAASSVVASGSGAMPFDATLGNAHKIAETEDTIADEIDKGGPVMYAILGLAGFSLLIGLYKFFALMSVGTPAKSKIEALLAAAERRDQPEAEQRAKGLKGPVGDMLATGAAHLREPKELVEEVMYERVLSMRLKLQRLLPVIAITAASAPLLGLLGTVTGIISTFQLITLYGTGDPKSLSGGISEALITTKYGLIVAVPSLLLYAFLNRKARGIIDQMEKSAVAFINAIGKGKTRPTPAPEPEKKPGGGPDKPSGKAAESDADSKDKPGDEQRQAA